jgi:hypothetical protein
MLVTTYKIAQRHNSEDYDLDPYKGKIMSEARNDYQEGASCR